MSSFVDLGRSANMGEETHIECSIISGVSSIADRLERSLACHGFHCNSRAAIVILVDTPRGFALHSLKTIDVRPPYVIVVTESTIPEYLDDLWDVGPDSLLVEGNLDVDLPQALVRVAHGERYRITPSATTPLTPRERRMLHLLAYGQSNQQIAHSLTMQHQTIRNTLTTIYRKLGLKNRNEAMLYYWGIWPVINRSYAAGVRGRPGRP